MSDNIVSLFNRQMKTRDMTMVFRDVEGGELKSYHCYSKIKESRDEGSGAKSFFASVLRGEGRARVDAVRPLLSMERLYGISQTPFGQFIPCLSGSLP